MINNIEETEIERTFSILIILSTLSAFISVYFISNYISRFPSDAGYIDTPIEYSEYIKEPQRRMNLLLKD